ncbi:hypothetical protein AAG570_007432 [Ranatra chinensis]|uniref:Uncharacterized protein n=1 Tax=Ranatra chinensis TaxID=642074 RepID=A0ABD0XVU6_9HEMI
MVEGGSMSGTSNACSSGGECFKESLKDRTLLEPANTQNGSSSSAPPYHTKISEEELLPNENSIWIYIIKGFNGCKAFYRYCKEVWNKAREIIHPLINTGVRTLLGPSNPHYDGNSSAPPDRRMKFCGEDLPPNEKLILTSIITAFDDCNAKYRYCSELLDKVQEIIPILNTESAVPHGHSNRFQTPEVTMKRKDTPLNEEVSNDLELDVSAGLYSRSNDKKSITSVDAVKYGGAKKGGNIGLKEEVSNIQDSAALAESRDGGSTADAAISSLNTERHGGSKKGKDIPSNDEVSKLISHKSNEFELDAPAGSYRRSTSVGNSISSVNAEKYGGAKKGGNIGLKEEVSNIQDSAALAESRDGGSTADAAISSLNTERHGGSKKGKDIPSNDEVSKLISHKSNEFELDAPAGSYRRSTSVGNSISSVNAEASAGMRSATRAGRKSVGGTSLYGQPGLRSKTQVEIRKNVKKYTFDERKLEELKNNNKSLAQRLKSIKERKSPLSWRSWYKSPETDKGEKIVTSKEKAAKCDNP